MSLLQSKREVYSESQAPSRLGIWQVRLVCLSVFGPYVTGSARTEQILVFGMFAWLVIIGGSRMMDAPCGPAPFLLTWCGLYLVMLIATIYRAFDPGFYGP